MPILTIFVLCLLLVEKDFLVLSKIASGEESFAL